jgi:hypothetical protein
LLTFQVPPSRTAVPFCAVSTGEPLSSRSQVTVADFPETVTASTFADVSFAWALVACAASTGASVVEPSWSRPTFFAAGVLGSKNAVQLSAIVFSVPVKADPDEVAAGVVAAGVVAAGAVVAAAVVAAGAEVAAEDEDEELELLHAASTRDATTAAQAASVRHLDR